MRWSVVLVFVGLVISGLGGCSERRGRSVRFVIPDNFRGVIKIMQTPDGVDVPIENDELIYRIPADGILRVGNNRGMKRWHYVPANFVSGAEINTIHPRGPDPIALFPMSTTSEGSSYYFLGTTEERDEASRKRLLP